MRGPLPAIVCEIYRLRNLKVNIENYKILATQKLKVQDTFGRPAGMSRTRKIIYAQKAMDAQFNRLCCQIRLDEDRQERAENQREERRAKRK
ncbi:hypothetical protein ACFLTE_06325 [Bacteroidota bacterium]